jgi:DNA-binding MarR family transcriptional regulator
MSAMDPTAKDQAVPSSRQRFRVAYIKALLELETLRLAQWERSRVTLPQLRVLFQVRGTPGITTGQLAQSLGITVSTTSGLVAKLAHADLVARGTSSKDRRQIPLELTETGRALAGELAEFAKPFLDDVAVELGDRLEPTIAALELLAEAVATARGEEGPVIDFGPDTPPSEPWPGRQA